MSATWGVDTRPAGQSKRLGGAQTVGIAILTWRGEEKTRTCIRSLKKLPEWPLPVLVIDNASGTGEGDRLATEFGPSVTSIERRSNDGVPGGYNAGIEWANDRGFDFVLLMNNDVVVEGPDFLVDLVRATGADVAAVGPMVLESERSVFSIGGRVDWTRGAVVHAMGRPTDSLQPAEWLDGSCLLVSVAAARVIGGLDSRYFMYWEDADWGLRATRAGYRCLVQPKAVIVHARGGRSLSQALRNRYYRNRILFFRKHGSARHVMNACWWLLRDAQHEARRAPNLPEALGHLEAAVLSLWWNLRDAAAQCWVRSRRRSRPG